MPEKTVRSQPERCRDDRQHGGRGLHLGALTFFVGFSSAACGPRDAGSPFDQAGAGDAGPDASADAGDHLVYDCTDLPTGPFDLTLLDGPVATEDFAFDDQGLVYGGNFDRPGIFRSPREGPAEVFAPNNRTNAGMDFLPNGHLVVADYGRNVLARIDPEGVEHIVVSGLAYPNGVTVGMDGLAYVSEHSGGRVRRVDAMTGEGEVLVETGTIHNPNGLSFSPDYRALYIVEFAATEGIWKLAFDAGGNPGALDLLVNVGGTGLGLDGIGVDACGNLYVTEFGGPLYRITADGKEVAPFLNLDTTFYLPNMEWGNGIGGWDRMSLYFPNDGVLEVAVGVPGKPRPFP